MTLTAATCHDKQTMYIIERLPPMLLAGANSHDNQTMYGRNPLHHATRCHFSGWIFFSLQSCMHVWPWHSCRREGLSSLCILFMSPPLVNDVNICYTQWNFVPVLFHHRSTPRLSYPVCKPFRAAAQQGSKSSLIRDPVVEGSDWMGLGVKFWWNRNSETTKPPTVRSMTIKAERIHAVSN